MIRYTNDYKTLVVPSSLGNFPSTGGGSGSGVTEEEVYDIVNSAITDYDTEIQVDLEDIRENVSGNTEDIQALSGATESISGSITAITASMDNLSGAVTSLTEGLEALSAATQNMGSDVDGLSGATQNIQSDVETLSGQTSAISGDLAALSASTVDLSGATVNGLSGANQAANSAYTLADSAMTAVGELSGVTQDVYDAIFYEEEGETYSQIDDLWGALGDKQDALEAGDGISLDSPNISVNAGKGLYFKEDGKMEVLLGPGLQYSGSTNALAAKIGEGLAFSGDTLVVSGGSSSGPEVYILNQMTQQELAALYSEIYAYKYQYASLSSGFPVQNYSFYYWAGDDNSNEFNDNFRGFVPMQLAMVHPDDYGGGIFFTGIVFGRGGSSIAMVRYIITSDGSTDMGRARFDLS